MKSNKITISSLNREGENNLRAQIEIVIIHAKEYFALWSEALNDSVFKKEAFIKVFPLIEKEIKQFAKKYNLEVLHLSPEWSLVQRDKGLARSINIVPIIDKKKLLFAVDVSKEIPRGHATLSKMPSILIRQGNTTIVGEVLEKLLETARKIESEDIKYIQPQGMYGPGPFSR